MAALTSGTQWWQIQRHRKESSDFQGLMGVGNRVFSVEEEWIRGEVVGGEDRGETAVGCKIKFWTNKKKKNK